MALAELNRWTAPLGAWTVKVMNPAVDEYEYHWGGNLKQGFKFEWLQM